MSSDEGEDGAPATLARIPYNVVAAAAGGAGLADMAATYRASDEDALGLWQQWQDELPGLPQFAYVGLARLFPHTAPATYRRWAQMRSAGADDSAEPLLKDDGRDTLFPIADDPAWRYRKLIEKLRWAAHEVRMDKDRKEAAELDPTYWALIERVLGFFGMSDERVLEGLDEVYSTQIKQKEAQHYLRAVAEQESVHSEAYSIQIQETVATNRRQAVFDAVKTMPAVGRMADWMRFWVLGDHHFADRLVASAHVEGVMFSAQFAIIQNTKSMNVLEGLTTFNEFISRDEGVHTQWWCFLLRERLAQGPDGGVAAAIAREVVELCGGFIDEAIPRPTGGLTAELLKQHVQSVSSSVSLASGQAPLFSVKSPFRFMDNLTLNAIGKANFFEKDVSQYQAPEADAYTFAVLDTPIGAV